MILGSLLKLDERSIKNANWTKSAFSNNSRLARENPISLSNSELY